MKRLRISYSLLSAWVEGRTDDAVAMYLHQPTKETEAMAGGKKIHDEISNYVNKHHKLPDFMPQISLTNPVTEQYHRVPYNDMFDLTAVFDMQDPPVIGEWKTGETDSIDWSRAIQIPFYFLVCEFEGMVVEKAYLAHYNQHIGKNDWVMVWNGPLQRARAINLIDSVGPEIYDFFSGKGLLD